MPTKLRAWTTIDEDAERLMADLKPGDMIPVEAMITPGEMLRLDYLEPMGVTPTKLARAIGVQPSFVYLESPPWRRHQSRIGLVARQVFQHVTGLLLPHTGELRHQRFKLQTRREAGASRTACCSASCVIDPTQKLGNHRLFSPTKDKPV